jgi:hypothetical protein
VMVKDDGERQPCFSRKICMHENAPGSHQYS